MFEVQAEEHQGPATVCVPGHARNRAHSHKQHACPPPASNSLRDWPQPICSLLSPVCQYLVNQSETAIKRLNGKSMAEGEGPCHAQMAGGGGKVLLVRLGCGGDSRRGAWWGWASSLCSTSVLCMNEVAVREGANVPQDRVHGPVIFLPPTWQGSEAWASSLCPGLLSW